MGEPGGHGTMHGSPEAINCLGQEMVKEICHPGGPGNIPKSPATPAGVGGGRPGSRVSVAMIRELTSESVMEDCAGVGGGARPQGPGQCSGVFSLQAMEGAALERVS